MTHLGDEAREKLAPLLETETVYCLRQEQLKLRAERRAQEEIASLEVLFLRAAAASPLHTLSFNTPTAFKRHGVEEYQILPTQRLILQNLMKKWNACPSLSASSRTRTGRAWKAMAKGLCCRRYRLHDQLCRMKRQTFPGFVGELTLENRLTGFHQQLAGVLLIFAGYAGVGIKTALGMGGTEHRA